jgi:hypothetical protein
VPPDVPWRWTDGDARLPITTPATTLIVVLDDTMTYVVEAAEPWLPGRVPVNAARLMSREVSV